MRLDLAALAAVAGLFLGAAMNVIVQRLPRERSLRHRPGCTRCGHPLSWELLPLAGYLVQRGRCRHCHKPIPYTFPLLELLTALMLGVLFLLHPAERAALYAVFSLALILTLFLDWLHRYIYYAVIVPAAAVALLGALLPLPGHPTILYCLLGMGIGVAFFGLLFLLGQILFHSQALGLGDVWLAGTIGAMAGFPGATLALALGMVMAGLGGGLLLLTRRGRPRDYMPYGSFLCLGALLYLCLWAPWSF